jgi:DNA-3-methyladenine glycosylase II
VSVSKKIIQAAREELAALDPALAKANAVVPPFKWRSRAGGFGGLVSLIVEQQVSVASAKAIWKKLEKGLGTVSVQTVLAQDVEQLKRLGLSGPKARYIRGVAETHARGNIWMITRRVKSSWPCTALDAGRRKRI